MNAKLIGMYNKEGMIYVYNLTGSKEELDQYVLDKENQGYNVIDKETGNVLLWSRKLIPGTVPVATDGKGGYFLDNSYDKAVEALIATSSPAEAAEIAKVRAHEKLDALKITMRGVAQRNIVKTDVKSEASVEVQQPVTTAPDLNQ